MQTKYLSFLLLGGCLSSGSNDPVWTNIPLVNDGAVTRFANDLVTDIYFSSPDHGYVATRGSNNTFSLGGAVFAISGSHVSIAFSGKNDKINFTGLYPTPTGVAATSYAADLIVGDSTGHFTTIMNGNLAGGEPVLAFNQTASGTTLITKNGIVHTSPQPPGPQAQYVDVWAPEVTENLPPDQCHEGPRGAGIPITRYSTYIGNGLIAYTAGPDSEPQICISTDGGKSFYPHNLNGQNDATPTGVVFTSAQNGITWSSDPVLRSYIQRTTDGGKTWHSVDLPETLANHRLRLNAGFFAPDGQHGWIVGYDLNKTHALGIATTDGGETWSVVNGLGKNELYSGFALDATHVWFGGDWGTLLTLL